MEIVQGVAECCIVVRLLCTGTAGRPRGLLSCASALLARTLPPLNGRQSWTEGCLRGSFGHRSWSPLRLLNGAGSGARSPEC